MNKNNVLHKISYKKGVNILLAFSYIGVVTIETLFNTLL